MKRLLALAVAAAILVAAKPVDAATYYLSLDQSAPAYGDSVTFTLTYPQDAAKNSRHPQFHEQPVVFVFCYQAGALVYQTVAYPIDKTHVGRDEWLGHTYPIQLPYVPNPDIPGDWTSGAADCTATSVYFTDDGDVVTAHTIATTTFHVSS